MYIIKTQGEWNALNEKVQALGKSDLHSYMRCEISRLMILWEHCRVCVTPASGDRIKIRHHIPDDIAVKLTELSLIMKKSPSTIIDQLILMPLLQMDKDAGL